MKIQVTKANAIAHSTDLLIIGTYEGEKKLRGYGAEIDKVLEGVVSGQLKDRGFTGKKHDTLLVQTHGRLPAKNILIVGLGKKNKLADNDLVETAAFIAKEVSKGRYKKIAFSGSDEKRSTKVIRDNASLLTEGLLLGTYHFGNYYGEEKKKERDKYEIEEVVLLADTAIIAKAVQAGLEIGTAKAEATMLARDLVNTPAADMTPKHMADVARNLAKKQKQVSVEVFDRTQAKKMGMNSFLGVAQGSDQPPYFIHLTYKPKVKKAKKIFLCGKGITFDTGGISLKPAQALEMWTMKMDMAGGAALLGLFSRIEVLAPKAEVHAVIPCTENMPSGKAMKPHDVVKAMNGKTIEVVNTDAEGRLVLADALSFAVKKDADIIIDLATLTGAIMVALGEEYAGIFSNNKKLTKQLKVAGDSVGEPHWEMPMPAQYKKLLKSPIADMRNVGTSRWGDSIIGGLFLQEFAGDKPWAHLDIAGPAWQDRPSSQALTTGATGFGVRTMIKYLSEIN